MWSAPTSSSYIDAVHRCENQFVLDAFFRPHKLLVECKLWSGHVPTPTVVYSGMSVRYFWYLLSSNLALICRCILSRIFFLLRTTLKFTNMVTRFKGHPNRQHLHFVMMSYYSVQLLIITHQKRIYCKLKS